LPSNNFTIQSNSETCRSSNNGSIVISAVENLNYTATLSPSGGSNTFTSSTSFENLEAGTYTVCITVENQPDYEICFDVVITQPEDLSVFSKVNTKSKSVDISLKGGDKYFITLNDEIIETISSSISLNLKPGINNIKITTDVVCQGEYMETFIVPFEGVKLYPNPVSKGERFYLTTGGIESPSVKVSIYSTLGRLISTRNYSTNRERRIEIDVNSIPKGVYLVNIESSEVNKSYTVIIE